MGFASPAKVDDHLKEPEEIFIPACYLDLKACIEAARTKKPSRWTDGQSEERRLGRIRYECRDIDGGEEQLVTVDNCPAFLERNPDGMKAGFKLVTYGREGGSSYLVIHNPARSAVIGLQMISDLLELARDGLHYIETDKTFSKRKRQDAAALKNQILWFRQSVSTGLPSPRQHVQFLEKPEPWDDPVADKELRNSHPCTRFPTCERNACERYMNEFRGGIPRPITETEMAFQENKPGLLSQLLETVKKHLPGFRFF